MIIVSVNKKKGKVALTSLMRDMYVQIPGYSDNRLNAAYAFGGMELLDETIEKNFAIDIDGNIEVNFDGFEAVIDAVGGVDIELNSAEVSHLNKKHSTWHLKVGMNHLDGEKALEYARIRKVGDGDFERTDRQRRVLTAVFDEMKNISITRLIALADELFPLLTTDMDNGEIIRLGINVLSMDLDTLETYRIPCDDAYDEVRVFARDGTAMDVLIPDLDLNRSYFYQNIYINP
nr:LCP family protein [Catenibacillus scindens]